MSTAPALCAQAGRGRPRPLARAWLGLALLLAAGALQLAGPAPAAAAVTHLHGFRATVAGFTSWYGSYGMGPLGTAWCIDHGIRSPDPAYAYAPADLSTIAAERQSAVAWAVARHGQGDDPAAHAGLMLALHDLMGATYPRGRLDVDHLTQADTAGFEGRADDVLAAARAAKADGLAHAALRGPLVLTLSPASPGPDGGQPVTVRVADQAGTGVGGLPVQARWGDQLEELTTADDGTATVVVSPGEAALEVVATATVPHLPLDAWASTTTPAQRVARPTLDELRASLLVAPTAPSTTTPSTSTTTSTSTTSTTTTSTTTAPTTTTTTTTAPPTSAPPDTAPPTTVPPTTVPPTTGPPTSSPPLVLSAPATTPTLPRTGADTATLALLAAGLLVIGWSCVDLGRVLRT